MRKRYKLFLIIFISFILVLFIYFFLKEEKFIYVSLGDKLSFNNFSTYNYTEYLKYYYQDSNITIYEYIDEYNITGELSKQINENTANINYYLKNASLITLSLGTIELYNYKELNEEVIINYLNNLYMLLNKLSRLNNNIYLINVYEDNLQLINKKISDYCREFNINYIDLSIINYNNVYQNELKTYLSYRGHKNIADRIVKNEDNSK
ncbi:MAG: hypothetical protein E7167_04840 [Firmicutes bacterium]|nr:hypothetical protein [Bacillota bacterium]